jgi:DNA-directed RNA polymerase specialized sigma24 family protein
VGGFKRLSQSELAGLGNEALVAYIAAAREAGERAAEKDAVGILAFGFEPTIRGWVRLRMGSASPQDIDDVVMEVLQSALRSSFEGKVVGEFGSFLKTITARRVVDYFRERGRQLAMSPLGSEHEGDDGVWGDEPFSEDDTTSMEVLELVDRLLAERNEGHRQVIRLYGPEVAGCQDLPAEEVAARVDGISVANVHKIWSRFKRDLEAELGG